MAESVVIHTSWRGRLFALVSPTLALSLGLWSLLAGGPNLIGVVLTSIGVVLAAVVMVDYPLTSTFAEHGIDRRCVFRTQTMPWDDVTSIARQRKRNAGGRSIRGQSGSVTTDASPFSSGGGLVAMAGRKTTLLSDKIESPAEYRAIKASIIDFDFTVQVLANEPAEGLPPTWLHKRRAEDIGPGMVDHGHNDR